jgi:pimeloyl-ACP methyl ester carboxylesterase
MTLLRAHEATESDEDRSLSEPYALIRLSDGRTLSYLQVGVPTGPVVFHFHGHGSSRLEALMLEAAALKLGVRVIALDRPGIGRSDPRTGDRLLDWPADVTAAADQLGIDKFAVQGMSAGGPYALACAHLIAARVTACSLVSTVPPPEIARRTGPRLRRFAWWVAHRFPSYLRRRLKQFRPDGQPDAVMIQQRMLRISQWLGGQDETLMNDDALRALLARTMVETARQGAAANREEIERLVRPWGFDVRHLGPTRMFIWHGEKDRIMPVGPVRVLAQRLGNCHAEFYPDEGHFSVLANRADELLAPLRVPIDI